MRIRSGSPLDLTQFESAREFWEQHCFAGVISQKYKDHRVEGLPTLHGLPWAPCREYFYPGRPGTRDAELERIQPKRLVPWESEPGAEEHLSDGYPKLQRYIPSDELPEDLLVLDPMNVLTLQDRKSRPSNNSSGMRGGMYRYRRAFPSIESSGDSLGGPETPLSENTAQLDLSDTQMLGSGDHGHVCLGTLNLPKSQRMYTVACKVSFASSMDREMIYDEARAYCDLPLHFQEDWTGFHYLSEADFDENIGVFPACAVVPRFYGFYLPVYDWAKMGVKLSKRGMAIKGNFSPVLLLEHCGTKIDPAKLTEEQRTCCYAFAARMHHAGFMHNSFHRRNILIQPGPLHHPPSQRSVSTPSFRLIDLGRTEYIGRSRKWKRLLESRSKWDTTQNADFDGRDTDTESDSSDDNDPNLEEEGEEKEKERNWRRIKEWLRLERIDAMNALYGWVYKRVVWVKYQDTRRRVGFYRRSYDE